MDFKNMDVKFSSQNIILISPKHPEDKARCLNVKIKHQMASISIENRQGRILLINHLHPSKEKHLKIFDVISSYQTNVKL